MPVADGSFAGHVLLIGAGFSKNWGGLLASEVDGRILAHKAVQARPNLGPLILGGSTFEEALQKARAAPFVAADALALETAIRAAFDAMDADYKNPSPPVLTATINDFLGRFCPAPVGIGTGYVFSLNQDLLLERVYGTRIERQKFSMPGIKWLGQTPPFPAGAHPIPQAIMLDPAASAPQLLGRFNHIKLHGSINWGSADGSTSMVMGGRKALMIARTPLLDWYHRVFEQVLFSGGVRLMVIGYGWGDEHINSPIADAVQSHGLQVYSWNPSHPRAMLEGKHRGNDILPGIMGFTTRPMTDVMPNSPMYPGSAHYDGIVSDFF